MGNITKQFINGDKLRKLIEDRKLTNRQVSADIGYSSWYISNCISRGYIGTPAIKLLEKLYNIKYDDYKIEEPEIEEEPVVETETETVNQIPFDYDKLRETIYDAVYWAVKKAWAE